MKRLRQCFSLGLFLLFLSLGADSIAQGKTLPYYTGFDTPQEKAGWTQYRLGYLSTYGWVAGSSLSHDYNVGGASTQTVIDWYVSPPLNCPDGATLSFKRQAGGFSPPTPDNCEVYFSAGKADPASGTYTLVANISSVSVQYSWQDTTIDIPFKSDSGYIAFKYRTVGAAWMTYDIDSIWVKAKPSTAGLREEPGLSLDMHVFPNPFSSAVTLIFNRNVDGSLMITDLQGRAIQELKNVSGRSVRIERGALPPGVYFLEYSGTSAQLRKKLIVTD